MRKLLTVTGLSMILAGCNAGSSTPTPSPATAGVFSIHENVGQFYADYTGPKRASLNAINAGGRYNATTGVFTLDAQMAGPINSGDQNYYVWGIQRGSGTAAPFPDEPNVIFDAVVVASESPTGTLSATVNLLNGNPSANVTAVLTAADTLEVTIPAANLPVTAAIPPAGFTWNLWPRSGVGGAAAAQIASFIPQNGLAPFAASSN